MVLISTLKDMKYNEVHLHNASEISCSYIGSKIIHYWIDMISFWMKSLCSKNRILKVSYLLIHFSVDFRNSCTTFGLKDLVDHYKKQAAIAAKKKGYVLNRKSKTTKYTH